MQHQSSAHPAHKTLQTVIVISTGAILLFMACGGSESPMIPPPNDVARIGPAGGTVTAQGLTIQVPPGALTTEVEITVDVVSTGLLTDPEWLAVQGTAYDLGPDGLTFQQPVEISIAYAESNVPQHFGEDELRMLRLDSSPTTLLGTVDAAAGRIRATTDHFSTFVAAVKQGPYQRIACPALQPAAQSAVPLDYVPLGALPESFQPPLLVAVSGADEGENGFGMVNTPEGGAPQLIVPLHPSASAAGGDVSLTVTDGTLACAPFDFQVLPLPPAPGELGAIVSLLQAILDERASVLDTSGDEIRALAVDDVPHILIPWVVMQAALDHPGNPRSLSAIATGSSSLGDTRLDLLEPLLARTSLRGSLSQALLRAKQRDPAPPGLSAAEGSASSITIGLCGPDIINGDTGLLNYCMGLARDAAVNSEGPTAQLLQDLGSAAGIVGLAPGLGIPADIIAFLTWLAVNEASRTAALLPSTLNDMVLEASPTLFLEDDAQIGVWSASVTANNAGWDIGKELLEAALQAASIATIFDKAELAGPEVNSVLSYVLTNPVAARLLQNGTDSDIEPEVFGPFSVTSEDWSESRIASGSAIELTAQDKYRAVEPGSATLAVKTTIEDGAFGSQQAAASAAISVGMIQMTITPDDIFLKPNEVQSFTVRVTDSKHPDMVALNPSGTLLGTASDPAEVAEGLHVVTYKAPPDPPGGGTDLLTVVHTATSGARRNATEVISATATIRFRTIRINASQGCVDPGGTLVFSADVMGFDNADVVWSSSLGTIGADGVFDPGGTALGSQVVITATSAEDNEVFDTFTITIGCGCFFEVTVGGLSYSSTAGDVARFRTSDFAPWNGSVWTVNLFRTGEVTYPNFENWTGLMIGPEGAGLPAPVEVGAGGNFGLLSDEISFASHPGEENLAPAIVTLTQLLMTENELNGQASGEVIATAVVGGQLVLRRTSYDLGFRIVLPDGYVPAQPIPQVKEYLCTVGGS